MKINAISVLYSTHLFLVFKLGLDLGLELDFKSILNVGMDLDFQSFFRAGLDFGFCGLDFGFFPTFESLWVFSLCHPLSLSMICKGRAKHAAHEKVCTRFPDEKVK